MCLPKIFSLSSFYSHRIHGAAIYGNMDPINNPQYTPFMLAYIPYMDPMGYSHVCSLFLASIDLVT